MIDAESIDVRVARLEGQHDTLERKFLEAFPGGDHVGHCRYHILMIEHLEERRRLRIAIQEKTISGLIWAALVGGSIAFWQWFMSQVRGG